MASTYVLRLHPRLGVLISEWRFGEAECWSDGVTEQSVMGWSVTSGKCDGAETWSGREDWEVDSKWRAR